MIVLEHLKKVYPEATPLIDVNAVINDGDVISVIGPSGTGKSTLIRCINMLETPTSGKVIIDGEEITAKSYPVHEMRKKMGMVFQSFNLFGHYTVIENVMAAPMDLLHKSKQEAYDKGIELLKMVGLADRALAYPDMLSGGQKQRVAIARTLAMDPEIILFDEPTSALDPTMVGEVQAVIRELSHSGKTMMIVTHEMKFAREICNRVFYMDQGGIYEDGTPGQIFDNPQKELTRRFIKRLKVCEIEINSRTFDLPNAMTEIEQYCYRSQIPRSVTYSIFSAFEELCVQILLPVLRDPVHMKAVIEYSEIAEEASLTVYYNGETFNPRTSQNALSLSVLSAAISAAEHSEISEEGFTNKITMKIK